MAPNSPARRLKRWVIAALCVLSVVLIALSPSFGRAEPTGEYRPPLPEDALLNGCYPLPEGVELDFSYQVRQDGDVKDPSRPTGTSRVLVVQYNLIDIDEAVAALSRSFERAGFEQALVGMYVDGRDDAQGFGFSKGSTEVSGYAVPMVPLKDDQIVRGTIQLNLPVVERQSDAPVCDDVESTKRFAEADQ